MIRSLVFDPTNTEQAGPEQIIRRNLTSEKLKEAFDEDCMMWVDIMDATEDEIAWVESLLDLNVIVVEDLKRKDARPTLLVYPDYLFVTLFEPGVSARQVTSQEIHCIVTNNALITVRPNNTKSIENAYDRVTRSPDVWQQDTAYFLYLATRHVIDAYYPALDHISVDLNRMEEELLEKGTHAPNHTQHRVHLRKQQLIKLRRMVAPQREVLSNVVGEKRLSQSAETRDLFRHLYERLLRVYDVIDTQRELCNTVLETIQSQESRELVQVVNRLTILSMIFLPLTFFTGLLELNFATTSEPLVLPINGQVMFGLLLAVMFLTVGWMVVWFRRNGWL